jgi:glycosyltransferase involved in cell wall biosynthesis
MEMVAGRKHGKNILFLSYRPNQGGVTTHICNQINFLEKEFQIFLVEEAPEIVEKKLTDSARENVCIRKIGLWTKRMKSYKKIIQFVKNRDISLICLNNYVILMIYLPIFLFLKFREGSRIFITHHSVILSYSKRRKLLEIAGGIASIFCDRIIYVSLYTKACWENNYFWLRYKNSLVCHNLVRIPNVDKEKKMDRGNVKIGFIGRISNEKGIKLYCEIAKMIDDKNLIFNVYGEGDMLESISLEYGQYVEIHGEVINTDSIYEDLDILLVTSPVENCPYSVLEAKSYGIPAIAPHVGGLPEIINSYYDGILIKEKSLMKFRSAIYKCIENYEDYYQNCLKSRDRYNIEKDSPPNLLNTTFGHIAKPTTQLW